MQEEPGIEVLQPQSGATLHRLTAGQRRDLHRGHGVDNKSAL